MSYANYNAIELAIKHRLPFTGNSAYATEQAGVYCIYSYQTLVASWDSETSSVWFNPRKYSQTTSRIQNIIRRAWGSV